MKVNMRWKHWHIAHWKLAHWNR